MTFSFHDTHGRRYRFSPQDNRCGFEHVQTYHNGAASGSSVCADLLQTQGPIESAVSYCATESPYICVDSYRKQPRSLRPLPDPAVSDPQDPLHSKAQTYSTDSVPYSKDIHQSSQMATSSSDIATLTLQLPTISGMLAQPDLTSLAFNVANALAHQSLKTRHLILSQQLKAHVKVVSGLSEHIQRIDKGTT